MNTPRPKTSPQERWFYFSASVTLLALTFIGFRMFYLEGRAFPGRPLTPPIRGLLIAHGIMMTVWILMAVVQPLLIATRHRRAHMTLGSIGAVLACAMVIVGVKVGIEAARFAPPQLRHFGLAPKEFMAVPVIGILNFAAFVLIGILARRRPDVHRPMMLLASLTVVSAALGRIPVLNAWYAGTWLEPIFTANLITVLLGVILLGAKCIVSRSFDRPFAMGVAGMTAFVVAISLGSKTQAWDQFATFLLK